MEDNNTVEKKGKTVTVESCKGCPFILNDIACNEDDTVELDPEFTEDDVPANCPMMDGVVREHDGDWVRLADYLRKQSRLPSVND
jgi:hypothetical protein